ncbi:hypothetical protein CDA63_11755 [Hymenobacter amundsenii]|uniref:Uncharacterized protein n=1 Tax=Hymenobacter amundsenii TaxID=2006685 RepID=A0A246FJY3_9BACT|nr:hypothetical protein [Hymenobacter amundsenii]OWP62886.1 hypothetical protein CDA63_11755 [Hymenobacter amundsenii]
METPAPIRLKDALALLESGTPVAVRFVTCDRRRKTGGEFRELKAARIGSGKRQAAAKQAPVPAGPVATPRNPGHFTNATRNLVNTLTGELVKVHIYLIVAVQGRKVII